jgi:hypothetical protein
LKFQARFPRPSRDNGTLLPALLAGVLVLMVALQFALPAEVELPPQIGQAAPARIAAREISRVVSDPAIARRALFTPGRGGTGSVASAGPLDGAVAVGMVRGRGFARALLQQSDGRAVSVPIGGGYRGWRLAGLNKDYAIFTRDGERVAMPFTKGNAQPSRAFPNQQANER